MVLAMLDLEGYLRKSGSIPGWMHRTDATAFAALSRFQSEAGVRADLLEIGTYHGRSAILMGYLLQPGERLVLCDLFEDQPGVQVRALGKRHYARVSQAATAANYARFHAVPPVMHRCPSTELLPRGLVAPPFRFMHIDGSHEPEVMRQDLATALTLLIPGGVVVFEDDHSVHEPGVPPAVRQAFEDRRLTALAVTPGKTYAVAGPDIHELSKKLAEWAATSPDHHPRVATFAGQSMLLLYSMPRHTNPWTGLDRKVGLRLEPRS